MRWIYFYPRPPSGGRQIRCAATLSKPYFYPCPPGGGRPTPCHACFQLPVFLSTPSGWRATVALDTTLTHEGISIHALRVEGDSETNAANSASDAISIHALRVEGDPLIRSAIYSPFRFLSTPSGWRATPSWMRCKTQQKDFYPRPPGGGRPRRGRGEREQTRISIHALRVEGDRKPVFTGLKLHEFLSTPSGWRATGFNNPQLTMLPIFLSTPSGWRATL